MGWCLDCHLDQPEEKVARLTVERPTGKVGSVERTIQNVRGTAAVASAGSSLFILGLSLGLTGVFSPLGFGLMLIGGTLAGTAGISTLIQETALRGIGERSAQQTKAEFMESLGEGSRGLFRPIFSGITGTGGGK